MTSTASSNVHTRAELQLRSFVSLRQRSRYVGIAKRVEETTWGRYKD